MLFFQSKLCACISNRLLGFFWVLKESPMKMNKKSMLQYNNWQIKWGKLCLGGYVAVFDIITINENNRDPKILFSLQIDIFFIISWDALNELFLNQKDLQFWVRFCRELKSLESLLLTQDILFHQVIMRKFAIAFDYRTCASISRSRIVTTPLTF